MIQKKQLFPSVIITLSLVWSGTGCGWGPESGDLPPNSSNHIEKFHNTITTPESVEATNGLHTEKIGLYWNFTDETDTYEIHRAESIDGEYQKIADVKHADIINIPVTPIDPGGGEKKLIQPVFISDIDLSGWGVYITVWNTIKIRITIGEVTKTVEFSGGKWVDINYYDQTDVIVAINEAFGKQVCKKEGTNFIRIESDGGSIILQNDTNIGNTSAIGKIFKSGVSKTEIVRLDPKAEDDPDDDPIEYSYYYNDLAIEGGKHYFYKVKALNDEGKSSLLSAPTEGFAFIEGAPGSPENISATYGTEQNKVKIEWDTEPSSAYYNVLRSDSINGIYEKIPECTNLDVTSFDDNNAPPGVYYYKVVGFNIKDEEGKHSNAVPGYRSIITPTEFFNEWNKAIKISQDKIPSMGGFGNHTIANDDPIGGATSGVVEYFCDWVTFMQEVTVDVTYHNYCDVYMILDSNIHTSITNVTAQRGICRGKVTVSGVYTGYIDHWLDIDDGSPSSGYYKVYMGPEPDKDHSAEEVYFNVNGEIVTP